METLRGHRPGQTRKYIRVDARLVGSALSLLLALFCCAAVTAAGTYFQGRLVFEWVDEEPFVAAMRLVEPFTFRQENGETWLVPAGSVVDGRSLSPLFVRVMGHPFEGAFRKTAVVYDHAARDMTRSWEEAQRMFFEGSVAEGVLPIEAKVMYALMNATGSRWALHESSTCFVHCHSGDLHLTWRPIVVDEQVLALAGWVRSEDPSLEEIEAKVKQVILHPGPHVFAYVRER